MLWNKNFTLLTIANVLLHWAVYMMFPLLYRWLVQEWGCVPFEAAGISTLFGIGVFLPGVFNNYLVDAFSRKKVGMYGAFLMALAELVLPYVPVLWGVALLRIVQGSLFGIVLMATGSTLVIDVTPRNKRDAANRVFTWAGVLGILIGLVIGLQGTDYLSVMHLLYLSMGCSGAAGILISLVSVCFRAPLDLPLCSLDRFILFRTLLPGVNMWVVPFVLGGLFTMIPDTFFYLCITSGFIGYILIRQLFTAPMNGRLQILIGQLLTAVGIVLLLNEPSRSVWYLSGGLIGLGAGFSLGQFLRMMILLPLHCERGTGYHTFQLLWHIGLMGGMLLPEYMCQEHMESPYAVALVACMLGFLFYQIYIHGYFSRHLASR